jgi:inosine-uridine nucleoside N-ribohydrolase
MFPHPFVTAALLAAGVLLAAVPVAAGQATRPAAGVKYILDTDLASDCDDAGALAVANVLARNGEAELLAVMGSTGGPYVAPAVSAINTWYGHGDVPIGTLRDPTFWVGGGPDQPAGWKNYESYNRRLAEAYSVRFKTGDAYPDAVVLYRQILAKQPDQSVVINTIGPLPNLANLMRSGPDEHSPLSGTDLIRAKVRTLVVTGGRQPAGTSSNFSKENAGPIAKAVIDGWPGRIVFVGNEVGHTVNTTWRRNAEANRDNPARMAYVHYYGGKDPKPHHTADQAGVLYAIRGTGELYELVEGGHLACDDKGHTRWVDAPAEGRQHAYVRKRPGVDAKLVETVETLMTQGR